MVNGNGKRRPREIPPEELALIDEQRPIAKTRPGQIDNLQDITEPPESDVPPSFDTFEPPVSDRGILTGSDFSPKRTAERLKLPETPAGAFEFFMNPPKVSERKVPGRKRSRIGGRGRIPDRPDLGINDSFGVEELFIQNDADAKRLRRSFF